MRGTETNYCALALIIAGSEEIKPEQACARMAIPMTGRRTLTEDDHALIKRLLTEGQTYREVAGLFGRTERAIQKSVCNRAKRERMGLNAGTA